MTSERSIEQYLNNQVRLHGGKSYKFVSPTSRGVADRIVLFPGGHLYFIELKTENGKQTKLQELFEYEMKQMGQKYLVIRSKEEVNKFIKEVTK